MSEKEPKEGKKTEAKEFIMLAASLLLLILI